MPQQELGKLADSFSGGRGWLSESFQLKLLLLSTAALCCCPQYHIHPHGCKPYVPTHPFGNQASLTVIRHKHAYLHNGLPSQVCTTRTVPSLELLLKSITMFTCSCAGYITSLDIRHKYKTSSVIGRWRNLRQQWNMKLSIIHVLAGNNMRLCRVS